MGRKFGIASVVTFKKQEEEEDQKQAKGHGVRRYPDGDRAAAHVFIKFHSDGRCCSQCLER